MISGNDETQPEPQEGEGEPCRVMQPRRPGWKWLLDALLAATVLVIVALIEFGTFPNHKGGFYCGDPKISFELRGDTIKSEVLITGILLIPAVVIWLVESCFLPPDTSERCNSVKDFLFAGLRQALWWYRGYLIGITLVVFVTEIGKVILGETRPHFLYTCRPDKAANCTPGSYVSDYSCTNKDDPYMDVSDSMRSFPSGHSSSSFFMSIFMMWYVQVRVHGDVSYLLISWLHCLFLSWCLACSLTRITDHRHHWWDVLAGSILGIVGAVFASLNKSIVMCSRGSNWSPDRYTLQLMQDGRQVTLETTERSSSEYYFDSNGNLVSARNNRSSTKAIKINADDYYSPSSIRRALTPRESSAGYLRPDSYRGSRYSGSNALTPVRGGNSGGCGCSGSRTPTYYWK